MIDGCELVEDGCRKLVEPHAPPGRRDSIANSLGAIHEQFNQEAALGAQALAEHWRAWTLLHEQKALVAESLKVAQRVREGFSAYVHVGIGGSDLGPRVCHEVLDGPFYNELTDDARGGAPRVYFAGDTFDPRGLRGLLELLHGRGELGRTAFNIVSRSGKTPETLCAFLAIKERLGAEWMKQTLFTTAAKSGDSILFDLAVGKRDSLLGVLPVPEGVGGRFSILSPVGLLPLAVTTGKGQDPGARVKQALQGYAAAHRCGLENAPDTCANIAFRIAYWLHLAEEQLGVGSLVLYDYSACRMLGDWLVQLYTESIQERGGGLNVIAARGPTSNHSLLNGIIGGPKDKVVLFLRWEDLGQDLHVPTDGSIEEEVGMFMGKDMMALQQGSCEGTITDLLRQGVPALELRIPRRDAECLFYVMRVFMDAVAVKGRLQGLHIDDGSRVNYSGELTYLQHGVEGYKQAMRDHLEGRGAERA